MKFILTPVDFSASTARVVDEAVRLVRRFEAAHLVLLHVLYPPEFLGSNVEARAHAGLLATMEAVVERQLAALKTAISQQGVSVHSLRLTGNPAEVIVEQAEKLDAVCIVVGAHGHATSSELVPGGTVNAVLKRARCPVVVVPLSARGARANAGACRISAVSTARKTSRRGVGHA